MPEIKINLHGQPVPAVYHGDWIDLTTAEEATLKAGEVKPISLGVAMELPKGYHAMLVARSSTPKNYGVIQANAIGIIDNAYRGDNDVWAFLAYAIRDTTIPAGVRIAQFRVMANGEPVTFCPVESLGNVDRGGIGSTGV